MRMDRATLFISVWSGLVVPLALAQQPANPPKEGVVPAEPGNPYRRAALLPARIREFTATQTSLQPGQSTTLVWEVENPTGITLEPGPGRVQPRGNIQVTPAATTTYTLTVHGPNKQVLTKEVTVTIAGTTPINTSASETAKKEVARLSNGKPDLSGVYDFTFGGGARGGARAAAPAGPVLKPGADKYRVVHGPEDAGQYSDCMPLAGPQAFAVPYQFQIVEGLHSVAILFGYPGTFRIIPTDGGAHPVDPDPTWMGDSIGRWDGDTLVIDSVGFNDKTEINGFRHTEALHIVERFSRPDYNTLHYEATLQDPNVFAEPWLVTRTFTLRPDLTKVDEFVCEHNEDYSKYFEKK